MKHDISEKFESIMNEKVKYVASVLHGIITTFAQIMWYCIKKMNT